MKTGVLELTETDLRAHTLWLRQLAARLLRDGPRGEDAAQDTWVAALRHPPALDRDLRPWLARVLGNFTRSGRRAQRRRERREIEAASLAAERGLGADELLERHEAARVVAAQVSRLPEPQRALVLLRYAEGLASKEIARQRGLPEGTVRRQLKTALDQLRAAVAAHYERDRRDWRIALAPLAPPYHPLAGAGKGVTLMAAKSKSMLGLAAVLVLALLLAGWRWSARETGPRTVAAPGSSSANGSHRLATAAKRSAPSAPEGGGAAPSGTAPPVFTGAAVVVDPARCPEKLAELRALASRQALAPSAAAFASAKPSPGTERQVAPIVERVLGQLPGKPSFQLECRASLCRVGVVSDRAEGRDDGPDWMRALGEDPAFTSLRGSNRSSRVESMPTRDALTGTTLLQHWLYFNVPLAAGEEHPFEASANATTCGERVAAIQKALEAHGEEHRSRQLEIVDRRRRFEGLPLNAELTRRVQVAAPIKVPGSAAPVGDWECRGQADCRWKGPASAMSAFDRAQLLAGLAAQGLSADLAMARVQRKGEGAESGEAELLLHLGPAGKSPPPNGTQTRAQVIVESVSTERSPP